jgi:hypothetical protein
MPNVLAYIIGGIYRIFKYRSYLPNNLIQISLPHRWIRNVASRRDPTTGGRWVRWKNFIAVPLTI